MNGGIKMESLQGKYNKNIMDIELCAIMSMAMAGGHVRYQLFSGDEEYDSYMRLFQAFHWHVNLKRYPASNNVSNKASILYYINSNYDKFVDENDKFTDTAKMLLFENDIETFEVFDAKKAEEFAFSMSIDKILSMLTSIAETMYYAERCKDIGGNYIQKVTYGFYKAMEICVPDELMQEFNSLPREEQFAIMSGMAYTVMVLPRRSALSESLQIPINTGLAVSSSLVQAEKFDKVINWVAQRFHRIIIRKKEVRI